MSTSAPFDKGNIPGGSRIPRTPVVLDVQKSVGAGRKRKTSEDDVEESAEVLREGDKTGGDTFNISGPSGPRPRSIARRRSSALAATSFFNKDSDKMTVSEIENNYKMNEMVPLQVQRLRLSVGSARSSLGSASSEDSFRPSQSQIDAEMKKNAILVPPPPKSTDNSGMTSSDGTPLSVSVFENAFKANANIIAPNFNLNSNELTSDQSNNSYNPSESKIIEAMKEHGPYVPPIKKSSRSSSFQSDSTDQLSDSVYEREFRKNTSIIVPGIKKSIDVPKTASVSPEDHDQDKEIINLIESLPASKKSDDRETEQITFEVEKEKETFTKETQPINVERGNNLEENHQSEDESSAIIDDVNKKLQRTTRKSLWMESIIEDSSAGPESTNKLRASTSTTNTNIMEVSKKNDESIMIETQEKMDLIERVPTQKTRSQSQPQLKGRITRNNNEADVMNNKNEKINHSTPIKKIAKKKNLNNLNLSAISSQENKGYNSLMSVKRPRLEKKQELLKKKSQISKPILKDVFEISPSASDNEENINHELPLKNDNKEKDDSETSFEEPEHLPSSCSINNDYDSESSIGGNEKEAETEKERKDFEKPKTQESKIQTQKSQKVNEELADSNDKNNKNDGSINKANNVKKPKVILPRKGSKINKAADKLRKKSLRGQETSKSPLKVNDPSTSPLKKRLRTSSRPDFNENNKNVENSKPLDHESTQEKVKEKSPLKSATKSKTKKAKKNLKNNQNKKIIKKKDTSKKTKIDNLRALPSNKQAVVSSEDKSLSPSSNLEKQSSSIQIQTPETDKNLNTGVITLTPFKISVPNLTPDEIIRIKSQLKSDAKANQEKTPPRNKSRSQAQTQVDVEANINKENTILPNSSSNADQSHSQGQNQSKKLSSSAVQPDFENEMEPEIIVQDIEATPKPASKLKSKVLDDKSIEKSSTSKSASLKISSKYKKKFQLNKRPIPTRPIELEHEPSSSNTMQLTPKNANKNEKVKLVKKKSAPEKMEYAKLYQLQNRLWGKMNTADIKLVHRAINDYIELFLNQIQSNCRNPHGGYSYIELERALAAEGLIPKKKGYLLSYMASIFNTEQMKLVIKNGLYPLQERYTTGNNFPE